MSHDQIVRLERSVYIASLIISCLHQVLSWNAWPTLGKVKGLKRERACNSRIYIIVIA